MLTATAKKLYIQPPKISEKTTSFAPLLTRCKMFEIALFVAR